jgi:hypothetical protein
LARRKGLEAAARRLSQALTELGRSPAPLESWRAGRVLGLVYRSLGNEAKARETHAAAASDVRTIADGIADADLREGFLAAAPVRDVLETVAHTQGGVTKDVSA